MEDDGKFVELVNNMLLDAITTSRSYKEVDAKKMVKELKELGLEERLALKMIEIMPDNASLVKLVLAMDKNRQPTDDETVGKILGVVKSYSK